MKIFKSNELKTDKRPDGRKIKQIGTISLNQKADNLHFLEAYHPSNFTEGQHGHKKSYEIFYFFDPAKYEINGEIYEINNGDIVVLEPGDKHGALEKNNETNILVIRIPWIEDDKINFTE
jgi:hypothetical protein